MYQISRSMYSSQVLRTRRMFSTSGEASGGSSSTGAGGLQRAEEQAGHDLRQDRVREPVGHPGPHLRQGRPGPGLLERRGPPRRLVGGGEEGQAPNLEVRLDLLQEVLARNDGEGLAQ